MMVSGIKGVGGETVSPPRPQEVPFDPNRVLRHGTTQDPTSSVD